MIVSQTYNSGSTAEHLGRVNTISGTPGSSSCESLVCVDTSDILDTKSVDTLSMTSTNSANRASIDLLKMHAFGLINSSQLGFEPATSVSPDTHSDQSVGNSWITRPETSSHAATEVRSCALPSEHVTGSKLTLQAVHSQPDVRHPVETNKHSAHGAAVSSQSQHLADQNNAPINVRKDVRKEDHLQPRDRYNANFRLRNSNRTLPTVPNIGKSSSGPVSLDDSPKTHRANSRQVYDVMDNDNVVTMYENGFEEVYDVIGNNVNDSNYVNRKKIDQVRTVTSSVETPRNLYKSSGYDDDEAEVTSSGITQRNSHKSTGYGDHKRAVTSSGNTPGNSYKSSSYGDDEAEVTSSGITQRNSHKSTGYGDHKRAVTSSGITPRNLFKSSSYGDDEAEMTSSGITQGNSHKSTGYGDHKRAVTSSGITPGNSCKSSSYRDDEAEVTSSGITQRNSHKSTGYGDHKRSVTSSGITPRNSFKSSSYGDDEAEMTSSGITPRSSYKSSGYGNHKDNHVVRELSAVRHADNNDNDDNDDDRLTESEYDSLMKKRLELISKTYWKSEGFPDDVIDMKHPKAAAATTFTDNSIVQRKTDGGGFDETPSPPPSRVIASRPVTSSSVASLKYSPSSSSGVHVQPRKIANNLDALRHIIHRAESVGENASAIVDTEYLPLPVRHPPSDDFIDTTRSLHVLTQHETGLNIQDIDVSKSWSPEAGTSASRKKLAQSIQYDQCVGAWTKPPQDVDSAQRVHTARSSLTLSGKMTPVQATTTPNLTTSETHSRWRLSSHVGGATRSGDAVNSVSHPGASWPSEKSFLNSKYEQSEMYFGRTYGAKTTRDDVANEPTANQQSLSSSRDRRQSTDIRYAIEDLGDQPPHPDYGTRNWSSMASQNDVTADLRSSSSWQNHQSGDVDYSLPGTTKKNADVTSRRTRVTFDDDRPWSCDADDYVTSRGADNRVTSRDERSKAKDTFNEETHSRSSLSHDVRRDFETRPWRSSESLETDFVVRSSLRDVILSPKVVVTPFNDLQSASERKIAISKVGRPSKSVDDVSSPSSVTSPSNGILQHTDWRPQVDNYNVSLANHVTKNDVTDWQHEADRYRTNSFKFTNARYLTTPGGYQPNYPPTSQPSYVSHSYVDESPVNSSLASHVTKNDVTARTMFAGQQSSSESVDFLVTRSGEIIKRPLGGQVKLAYY